MKNLVIIGARGYGREIYNYTKECEGYNERWIVKGFLDDKPDALADYLNYPEIIDTVENYKPHGDDVFVCALGEVKFKKKYTLLIQEKGGEFINLIHHSANVGMNTKMGIGCIILPNVIVSCDVKMGSFVTLQTMVAVGHDAVIGDYCHLNAFSFLGGSVILESEVTIHTKACVLPKLKIETRAVVGAGSIVLRNVKSERTVFGNPAKEIV